MIRRSLDDESDFVVCDSEVTFRQTFETVEFAETFSRAPPEIIEAARKVLTSERIDSLPKTVRETVHFSVGCNQIPLFASVSGGRGRSLFEFRCVFEGCSAFLDIRMFSGVAKAKWVVMGISHSHSFDVCWEPIFCSFTSLPTLSGSLLETRGQEKRYRPINLVCSFSQSSSLIL